MKKVSDVLTLNGENKIAVTLDLATEDSSSVVDARVEELVGDTWNLSAESTSCTALQSIIKNTDFFLSTSISNNATAIRYSVDIPNVSFNMTHELQ